MTLTLNRPTNSQYDPSQTTLLRKSFAADMQRRIEQIKSAIWQLIVTEDVFGHRERKPLVFNAWSDAARRAALAARLRRRRVRQTQLPIPNPNRVHLALAKKRNALVSKHVQDSGSLSVKEQHRLAVLASHSKTKQNTLQRIVHDNPKWTQGETLHFGPTSFTGVDVKEGRGAGDIGWKSTDGAIVSIQKPKRGLDVDYKQAKTKGFSAASEKETIVSGWYRVIKVEKIAEPGTNPEDGYKAPHYVLEEVKPKRLRLTRNVWSDAARAASIAARRASRFLQQKPDLTFRSQRVRVELSNQQLSAIRGMYGKNLTRREIANLVGALPLARWLNFSRKGTREFLHNTGYQEPGISHFLDSPRHPFVRNLALNTRFKFETSDEKLKSFNRWFANQVKKGILQVDHTGKPWTSKYVDSAYKKGRTRAYIQAKDVSRTHQSFLNVAFNSPEVVSKLRLLGTRNFEQLKGITADMSSQLNRILASGIAAGRAPREIAREISKSVDGINKRRAQVLARTELIMAHAEGQLDSYQEMGIEGIKVLAEFLTAGDKRVCPKCNALSGKVFTIAQARGLIPVHPSCRCAWSPVTNRRPSKLSKAQQQIVSSRVDLLSKPTRVPTVPKPPPTAAQFEAYNIELSGNLKDESVSDAAKAIRTQLKRLQKFPAIQQFQEESKPLELQLKPVQYIKRDKTRHWSMYDKNKIIMATEMGLPTTDHAPKVGGHQVSVDVGSVFRHEYGHLVWDKMLGKQQRDGFKQEFDGYVGQGKKEVSTYGASSIKQLFAETFAAVTSSKYLKGLLPQSLEDWLFGLLNK